MSETLVPLTRAVRLLAQARTLDEVTHVRGIAQAAEQYARAEKLGDEAERYAREIRVRAARKAGELLAAMASEGNRRPSGQSVPKGVAPANRHGVVADDTVAPTLSDLGITKYESSRWQRLALVPEPEFEERVAQGWGESSLARSVQRPKTAIPNGVEQGLPQERGRIKGPSIRQSFRGLEQAVVQLQGLAEALEGELYGDWTRLYDLPEAAPLFDVIAESLPVVNARLKRTLRERGSRVAKQHAG